MTDREAFFKHVAQTSPRPIGLEVDRASGSYVYTVDGKRYLDFISGICVANVGHSHPDVVRAVVDQAQKHLHVMVYGEYIQAPQTRLAARLAGLLPESLSVVYLTNSGTEANEGALKVAKKFTGRKKLISFEGSFHGDSQGACSVTGREIYRKPFEPLLPDVSFLPFDRIDPLRRIDERTAAVIVEPIQGEGGIRIPSRVFLSTLRRRCSSVGALLIFDEVQTGFGRTGRLFAFEHFGVVPDILTLAKGMGGGMPLGAFVSRPEVMKALSEKPPLSHVTTFGGHPVSCAAGLASLELIVGERLAERGGVLGERIQERLRKIGGKSGLIKEVRGKGMMIGLEIADGAATE
ncbi:MAG TPA: aspartate aminotransferase family protein, partial [Nitrospiria bacterium]|nr:aspartate aminotransferase family protein [Nitrospiria bacterium]